MTWAFAIDSVHFTPEVIAGTTSLGGSESACLGLARALVARGHTVHIFTSKIAPDAVGKDASGLVWHEVHDFWPMNEFIEWDVVVALRWFAVFGLKPMQARWRMLWNQDLLVPGQMADGVMAGAWAYDELAYVSAYHQSQWEDLRPELKGLGWVTRNGIDLSQVPKDAVKDPTRIIHISRPERGLNPLLKMWPALRKANPKAELRLCRYSSMYDQGGWGEVCKAFDSDVAMVNQQVGGITWLGELNKADLYREISEAAVMWYPGVAHFAETSCIAATEANACGTPFVGSLKGALVETARPSYEAGLLIAGNAEKDEAYQAASVAAVLKLMQECNLKTFTYRQLQKAQRAHAAVYDYNIVAKEWEDHIETAFAERLATNQAGVLRQLVHDDDQMAAKALALEMGRDEEVATADSVIYGKSCSSTDYSTNALQDPIWESESCTRFHAAAARFKNCRKVLDVACGNGAMAITLARVDPKVRVHGIDYSAENIALAEAAAKKLGVSDRITFEQVAVYDFDAQAMHEQWQRFQRRPAAGFDGMFVGEFLEHVAECSALVDSLESVLDVGAVVVYTCPAGPYIELRSRNQFYQLTHVHRFHQDDLQAIFDGKRNVHSDYLASGWSGRGNPIGAWLLEYRYDPTRLAGRRDVPAKVLKTRPMPRLSVGIIAHNEELNIGRCLDSIWAIADEIVVGDCGSTDTTAAIAKTFGARVLTLPAVNDFPDGFAGARNAVLAECTGEWFLWIDSDELLVGGNALRRYMETHVFNGFVIHQNNLKLDAPNDFEIPVRCFRRRPDIQFYGCIHEQPQAGDCNTDISPIMDISDVQIAHTGYLTHNIREQKMLSRNTPMMVRDQQVFPDRVLGKALLLRESVIQSGRAQERAGGKIDEKASRGYAFAIQMFRDLFADPSHKYHAIIRPWYEQALRSMGLGWEVEIALAGRRGGLEGRTAKPERVWVLDAEELTAIIAWRSHGVTDKMPQPVLKTDPFVVPEVVTA